MKFDIEALNKQIVFHKGTAEIPLDGFVWKIMVYNAKFNHGWYAFVVDAILEIDKQKGQGLRMATIQIDMARAIYEQIKVQILQREKEYRATIETLISRLKE